MDDPCILLPMKCPQCGAIDRVAFPVIVVVTAVTAWRQMRMFATCHGIAWDASPSEIRTLREHLGERWLKSARCRLALKSSSAHTSPAIQSVFRAAAAAHRS
jgi:hypothetical protein